MRHRSSHTKFLETLASEIPQMKEGRTPKSNMNVAQAFLRAKADLFAKKVIKEGVGSKTLQGKQIF